MKQAIQKEELVAPESADQNQAVKQDFKIEVSGEISESIQQSTEEECIIYPSHFEADLRLASLQRFAYISFSLPLFVLLGTLCFSLLYTPTPRDILFNHFGALYRQEDLTKSTLSEGEVKQLATKWITHVFSYNHVSFSDEKVYSELMSGKRSTSLPDHRDEIRAYFSDDAYPDVISSLEKAPWMADFREQRRGNNVSFYTPPSQDGQGAELYLSASNRLSARYKGYLYISSSGYRVPERFYRVDFEVVLERKPNNVSSKMPAYFFPPMVPDNFSEWRFTEFTWSAKRER